MSTCASSGVKKRCRARNNAESRQPPQIDSQALASALVGAMQQAGVVGNMSIIEEKVMSLPSPGSGRHTQQEELIIDEPADVKIARAYEALMAERVARQESKPISARDLALRAKVRRSTCSEWLQQQGTCRLGASGCQNEGEPCVARKEGRMHSSFPRPNTLSEETTRGLDP